MKVLLRLVCFTALLISSLKTDKCENESTKITLVSYADEIDVRSCPLPPNVNNATVIWYKNGSTTPVSIERDSRIHQYKEKLWFVPAMVEDSGYYYCAVRNLTYCIKLKFVKNESDLCYNTQAVVEEKLPVARSGPLVCPHVEFLGRENYEFFPMQWYKDCKPLLLPNANFTGVTNKLIISNVNDEHRGNYTCRGMYNHLGQQYFVTRAIRFVTIERKISRLAIMSPANETMVVHVGSQLLLICNVTGQWSDNVYWKWNGSLITGDNPGMSVDYSLVKNPSSPKSYTIIAALNISKVQHDFYLYPFFCTARNSNGMQTVYIQLAHPVPDYQKLLIGIFVVLTIVIVCSVFIYKIFKVDIILWYRDSCYDFLPKKASDGKIYDAYVLYPKTLEEGSTSNSDIFVFNILPEVLEKQCGYKLFIYGRDDDVGEDIIEVINENIKKSRRLIVILVQGILGLSWLGSSSEEQIAMYNALIKDGIRVLLLELEKIQDYEKMPESIQFIKQKQGALRWSGNVGEETQSVKSRFWKKVRYHMPVQRKPHPCEHQLLSVAPSPESQERLPKDVHVPLG
ncbi:interleukin-1 receptor type 1 [Sorex araneus]|uniref:interleukin-1 receptor type 1 n=1 Tax=Sorex araneus TaxID=42254 RepID=UPI002433F9C5|nr:interleukin-1 receptor type 1 [Sorex araneus]XP_054977457.1 interleukin-1 receptor type 1 [Sorex araneus]XP_054977458.1 interleukin-1 receptor type 1 [Sorex araneus]